MKIIINEEACKTILDDRALRLIAKLEELLLMSVTLPRIRVGVAVTRAFTTSWQIAPRILENLICGNS